jgi:hypothetical protein
MCQIYLSQAAFSIFSGSQAAFSMYFGVKMAAVGSLKRINEKDFQN